jgi:hypothetical protein
MTSRPTWDALARPGSTVLAMIAIELVELKHALVGEKNGGEGVLGHGNGVGGDGIGHEDPTSPDHVVQKALDAAGQVRDQLQARQPIDDAPVDRRASPAGDQNLDLREVLLHGCEVPKRCLADEGRHVSEALHVVRADQLVSDDRVHHQRGRVCFGHTSGDLWLLPAFTQHSPRGSWVGAQGNGRLHSGETQQRDGLVAGPREAMEHSQRFPKSLIIPPVAGGITLAA